MGFAPPPYDGFALLASAHKDALGRKHIPNVLAFMHHKVHPSPTQYSL